jgi:hypothetical protein
MARGRRICTKNAKFLNLSVCNVTRTRRVDMNFDNGTVDSIRSISQRGLAAYWARLALTKQGLPPFDLFEPGPGVHDPKHIAVWKVEAGGGQLDFRALYRGSFIDEAVVDDWVGKTLAEVAPPTLRSPIIDASAHCASSGCAIYTVLRTCDGAGLPLDLERLLLPFGQGGRVQVIVASLQLVSLEGKVERRKAVENFEAQTEIVLSFRISAASFKESRPKRADLLPVH